MTPPDVPACDVIVAETATTDTLYGCAAFKPVNVQVVVLTEHRFPPGDNVATYVVIVDWPDVGTCHDTTRDFDPPRDNNTFRGSLTFTTGATVLTGATVFTGAMVFTTDGTVFVDAP